MNKATRIVLFSLLTIGLLAPGTAESIGLMRKPKPSGDDLPQDGQPGGGPEPYFGGEPQAGEQGEQPAKTDVVDARGRQQTIIEREQRRNLKRSAQLKRIQALGIEGENRDLVDRARTARENEDRRHELAMKRLLDGWHELDRTPGARI